MGGVRCGILLLLVVCLDWVGLGGASNRFVVKVPHLFDKSSVNGYVGKDMPLVGVSVNLDAGAVPVSIWTHEEQVWVVITVNEGGLLLKAVMDIEPVQPTSSESLKDFSSVLSFKGSLDSVNEALSTLVYRGKRGRAGKDELKMSVNGDEPQTYLELLMQPVKGQSDLVLELDKTLLREGFLEDSTRNNLGSRCLLSVVSTSTQLSVLLESSAGSSMELGDGTRSFSSSSEVNAILADSLYYSPPQNWSGDDIVKITVVDEIASFESSVYIIVRVDPVNDMPVITAPTKIIAKGMQPNLISGVKITDIDYVAGVLSFMELQMNVGHGQLKATSLAGVYLSKPGEPANSKTLSGSLDSLNRVLQGIIYIPNSGYQGKDTLELSVKDEHGLPSLPISIDIDVSLHIPGPTFKYNPGVESVVHVQEGSKLDLGVTFSLDIEEVEGVHTATIEVLLVGSSQGGAILSIDDLVSYWLTVSGNNTNTLTMNGSMENLRAGLSKLSLTPEEHWNSHKSGKALLVNLRIVSLHHTHEKLLQIFVDSVHHAPVLSLRNPKLLEESLTAQIGLGVIDLPFEVSDVDDFQGLQSTSTVTVLFKLVGKPFCGTLFVGSNAPSLTRSGIQFASDESQGVLMSIKGDIASVNVALSFLQYKIHSESHCDGGDAHIDKFQVNAVDDNGLVSTPIVLNIACKPANIGFDVSIETDVIQLKEDTKDGVTLAGKVRITTLQHSPDHLYTVGLDVEFGTLALGKLQPGIRAIVQPTGRSVVLTGHRIEFLQLALDVVRYHPLNEWSGIEQVLIEVRDLPPLSSESILVASERLNIYVTPVMDPLTIVWSQVDTHVIESQMLEDGSFHTMTSFRGLVIEGRALGDGDGGYEEQNPIIELGFESPDFESFELLVSQENHGIISVTKNKVRASLEDLNSGLLKGYITATWTQDNFESTFSLGIRVTLDGGDSFQEIQIQNLSPREPLSEFKILVDGFEKPFLNLQLDPIFAEFGILKTLPKLQIKTCSSLGNETRLTLKVESLLRGEFKNKAWSESDMTMTLYDANTMLSGLQYFAPETENAGTSDNIVVSVTIGMHTDSIYFPILLLDPHISTPIKFVPTNIESIQLRSGAPHMLFAKNTVAITGGGNFPVYLNVSVESGASISMSNLGGLKVVASEETFWSLFGEVRKLSTAIASLKYRASTTGQQSITLSTGVGGSESLPATVKKFDLDVTTSIGDIEKPLLQDEHPLGYFKRKDGSDYVHTANEHATVDFASIGWEFIVDDSATDSTPVFVNVTTSHGSFNPLTFRGAVEYKFNQEQNNVSVFTTLSQVQSSLEFLVLQLPHSWNSLIDGGHCLVQGTVTKSNNVLLSSFELPIFVKANDAEFLLDVHDEVTVSSGFDPINLGEIIQVHRDLNDVDEFLKLVLKLNGGGSFEFPEYTRRLLQQSHDTVIIDTVDTVNLNLILAASSYFPPALQQGSVWGSISIDVSVSSPSTTYEKKITIFPPHETDAPVKGSNIHIPHDFMVVAEDTSAFHVNGLSLGGTDVDRPVVLRVSATHGTVFIDGSFPGSKDVDCGKGEHGSLSCVGVPSALNVMLMHLRYTPVQDYFGLDDVHVDTETSSATIPVLVEPVDDTSQISFQSDFILSQNTSLELSVPLVLEDKDGVPEYLQVQVYFEKPVQANFGTFSVSSSSCETTFTEDKRFSISGTIECIKDAVKSLTLTIARPVPSSVTEIVIVAEVFLIDASDVLGALQDRTSQTIPFQLPPRRESDKMLVTFEHACSLSAPLLVTESTSINLAETNPTVVFDSYYETPDALVNMTVGVRHGALSVNKSILPTSAKSEQVGGKYIYFTLDNIDDAQSALKALTYTPNDGYNGVWSVSMNTQRLVPRQLLDDSWGNLEILEVYTGFISTPTFLQALPSVAQCFVSVTADTKLYQLSVPSGKTVFSSETEILLSGVQIAASGTKYEKTIPMTCKLSVKEGHLSLKNVHALRLGVSLEESEDEKSVYIRSTEVTLINSVLTTLRYERKDEWWFGQDVVTITIDSNRHVEEFYVQVEKPEVSLWETSLGPGYLTTPTGASDSFIMPLSVSKDMRHFHLNGLDVSSATINTYSLDDSNHDIVVSTDYGWLWSAQSVNGPFVEDNRGAHDPLLLVVDPVSETDLGPVDATERQVERIQTIATDQPQIQILKVEDLDSEEAVVGTFRLRWNGRTSTILAHDISNADMETAINNIPGIISDVTVSQVSTDTSTSPESYTWEITFVDKQGTLPHILELSEPSFSRESTKISTSIKQHANQLGGWFRLGFLGFESAPIPWDADANVVKHALQLIPCFSDEADISVELTSVGSWGEREWTVLFNIDGNLDPLIVADSTFLQGVGAEVQVFHDQSGRLATWGSFYFRSGAQISSTLYFHQLSSSGKELIKAFTEIGVSFRETVGAIHQTLNPLGGTGGVVWDISPLNLIDVQAVATSGTLLTMSQIRVIHGSKQLTIRNRKLNDVSDAVGSIVYRPESENRARESIHISISNSDSNHMQASGKIWLDIMGPFPDQSLGTHNWESLRATGPIDVDYHIPTPIGNMIVLDGSSSAIYTLRMKLLDSINGGKSHGLRLPNDLALSVEDGTEALSPRSEIHKGGVLLAQTVTVRGSLEALRTAVSELMYVPRLEQTNWWATVPAIHMITLSPIQPDTRKIWSLETALHGGTISGEFAITVKTLLLDAEGRETGQREETISNLDASISSELLENELQGVANLPEKVAVKVDRSAFASEQGTYSWKITVFEPTVHAGAVISDIVIHNEDLTGSDEKHTPTVSIVRLGDSSIGQVNAEINCGENIVFSGRTPVEEIKRLFAVHAKADVTVSKTCLTCWKIQVIRSGLIADSLQCSSDLNDFKVSSKLFQNGVRPFEDKLELQLVGNNAELQIDVNLRGIVDSKQVNNDIFQLTTSDPIDEPYIASIGGENTKLGNLYIVTEMWPPDDAGLFLECTVESTKQGKVGINFVEVGSNTFRDSSLGRVAKVLSSLVYAPRIPNTLDTVKVSCAFVDHPYVQSTTQFQVLSVENEVTNIRIAGLDDVLYISAADIVRFGEDGFYLSSDDKSENHVSFSVKAENGHIHVNPVEASLKDIQISTSISEDNSAVELTGPIAAINQYLGFVVYTPKIDILETMVDTLTFKIRGEVSRRVMIETKPSQGTLLYSDCGEGDYCILRGFEDTSLVLDKANLVARPDPAICESGLVRLQVSSHYGTLFSPHNDAKIIDDGRTVVWSSVVLENEEATKLLSTLQYHPRLHWYGRESVSVTATCLKDGIVLGGFTIDVKIDVENVVDIPSLTVNDEYREIHIVSGENETISLEGAFVIEDPDFISVVTTPCIAGSSSILELRLGTLHGGLVCTDFTGATIITGKSLVSNQVLVVTGCVDTLKGVLNNIEYIPPKGVAGGWTWHGSDSIKVSVKRLNSDFSNTVESEVSLEIAENTESMYPVLVSPDYWSSHGTLEVPINTTLAIGSELEILLPPTAARNPLFHISITTQIGLVSVDVFDGLKYVPHTSSGAKTLAGQHLSFQTRNRELVNVAVRSLLYTAMPVDSTVALSPKHLSWDTVKVNCQVLWGDSSPTAYSHLRVGISVPGDLIIPRIAFPSTSFLMTSFDSPWAINLQRRAVVGIEKFVDYSKLVFTLRIWVSRDTHLTGHLLVTGFVQNVWTKLSEDGGLLEISGTIDALFAAISNNMFVFVPPSDLDENNPIRVSAQLGYNAYAGEIQEIKITSPHSDPRDSCIVDFVYLQHNYAGNVLELKERTDIAIDVSLVQLHPLLVDQKIKLTFLSEKELGAFSLDNGQFKRILEVHTSVHTFDLRDRIQYTGIMRNSGWDRIQVILSSDECPASSSIIINVFVEPINNAPVISIPSELQYSNIDSGERLSLASIAFSDEDEQTYFSNTNQKGLYNLFLSVNTGGVIFLDASVVSGVEVFDMGSTIEVRGGLESVNEAIRYASFNAESDWSGTSTIEVRFSDNGFCCDGAIETVSQFIQVFVSPPKPSVPRILEGGAFDALQTQMDKPLFFSGNVKIKMDDGRPEDHRGTQPTVYTLTLSTTENRSSFSVTEHDDLRINQDSSVGDSILIQGTKRSLERWLTEKGNIVYVPESNWCGHDEVRVGISESNNATAQSILSFPVNVVCTSQPPSVEILNSTISTLEDMKTLLAGVRVVDSTSAHRGCNSEDDMVQISFSAKLGSIDVDSLFEGIQSVSFVQSPPVFSIVGCWDDVNYVLTDMVYYAPPKDLYGRDEIYVYISRPLQATNLGDNALVDSVISIDIQSVNDTPIIVTENEDVLIVRGDTLDVSYSVEGLKLIDVDSETHEGYTVSFSSDNGNAVVRPGIQGLEYSDNGSTVSGLLELVNNAISQVTYKAKPGFIGFDVLQVVVTDRIGNITASRGIRIDIESNKQVPIIHTSNLLTSENIPPLTLGSRFSITGVEDDASLLELEIEAQSNFAQPEIQEIVVTKDTRLNVQVVELSASKSALAAPASFVLHFEDDLDTKTTSIDRAAGDMISREYDDLIGTSMETKLRELNPSLKCEVRRSSFGENGGMQWIITFHSSDPEFPLLKVFSESDPQDGIAVTTYSVESPVYPSGEFSLEFAGRVTKPINVRANARTMQQALQSLPTVDLIDVSKTEASAIDTWRVTFFRPTGDVPLLRVGSSDLSSVEYPIKILISEVKQGYGISIIQHIATRANHINQVQQVRTTADAGVISGGFRLAIDLSSIGGKFAVSELIDHDAVPGYDDERASNLGVGDSNGESMESKLNKMLQEASEGLSDVFRGFTGAITVKATRTDQSCDWSCRSVVDESPFPLCSHNTQCDKCVKWCIEDSLKIVLKQRCVEDSDCSTGECKARGECISNGKACDLHEDCTETGICNANNCALDPNGGRIWTVTFFNAPHNFPMMTVQSNELTTATNPLVAVDVAIDRNPALPVVYANKVGGSFMLGSEVLVPCDITAQELQKKITQSTGTEENMVHVIQSLPDLEGGYDWFVMILDQSAFMNLSVTHDRLTGIGARATLENEYQATPVSDIGNSSFTVIHQGGVKTIYGTGSSITLVGVVSDVNNFLACTSCLSFLPDPEWYGDVRFVAKVSYSSKSSDPVSIRMSIPKKLVTPKLQIPSGPVQAFEDVETLLFEKEHVRIDGRDDDRFSLSILTKFGYIWIKPKDRLLFRSKYDKSESQLWENPSQTIVFEGTISEINDALSTSLYYKGKSNFSGIDELEISVSTEEQVVMRTMFVKLLGVYDPPLLRLGEKLLKGQLVTKEDERIFLSSEGMFQVGDADGDEAVSITFSAHNGMIDVSVPLEGIEKFVLGKQLTLRGTPVELTIRAFPNVFYKPDSHYHGKDSILIQSVDLGARNHSVVVPITILPENDAPKIATPQSAITTREDSVLLIGDLFAIDDVDLHLPVSRVEQIVETYTNHRNAQQYVRTTAGAGTLSGGFKLSIDLRSIGGMYAESELIDHNAVPSESDEYTTHVMGAGRGHSMESKLNEMLSRASVGLAQSFRGGTNIKVAVSRSDQKCDFSCYMHGQGLSILPLCSLNKHCDVCVGTCANSAKRCYKDDDCGGSTCSMGEGECLSSGTPCPCIGTGHCQSTNCVADTTGGYTWTVTFLDAPWNLPMMSVSSNALVGATNPRVAVDILVDRDPALPLVSGNGVEGKFTIGTVVLDAHVTAEDMEEKLSSYIASKFKLTDTHKGKYIDSTVVPIPDVSVSKSLPDLDGGCVWTISFSNYALGADIDSLLLPVSGEALSGTVSTRLNGVSEGTPDMLEVKLEVMYGELEERDTEGTERKTQVFSFTSGKLSDVKLAMNTLSYRPPLNWNTLSSQAFDVIKLTLRDFPNKSEQARITNANIVIDVKPVNDAPVITLPGELLDSVEATMDMLSKVVVKVEPYEVNENKPTPIRGIRIRDIDVNDAEDAVLEVSLVAFNGTIFVSDSAAAQSLRFIGTVDAHGYGPSFTTRGTLDGINRILDTLMFKSRLTEGLRGTGALVVSVNDLGNQGGSPDGISAYLTDSLTLPIDIRPSSDPPRIVLPKMVDCDEDDSIEVPGIDIIFPNFDSSGKIDLRISVLNGYFTLTNVGSGVDQHTPDSEDGLLSEIHVSGTVSAISLALQNGVYTPKWNFHTAFQEPDEVTLTVSYPTGADVTKSFYVNVAPVNDGPMLHVADAEVVYVGSDRYATASVRQLVMDEDETLVIDGIAIEDVDTLDRAMEMHMVSSKGSLRLSSTEGVDKVIEVENGEEMTKLTGTLERLNFAVRTLHYTPQADWNGEDNIVLTITDFDGLQDTVSIPILVRPVNDFPQWTLGDIDREVQVQEDGSVHIAGVSLSDIDLGPEDSIYVEVFAAMGSISSISTDEGRTSTLRFNTTLAKVNDALLGLMYHPKKNRNSIHNELDRISFLANDQGWQERGSFRVSEAYITITKVIGVNDPPRILVPGAHFSNPDSCQTEDGVAFPRFKYDISKFSLCGAIIDVDRVDGVEDTPLNLEGIRVFDPDGEDTFLQLTLEASHGRLHLWDAEQVIFTSGTRNGDHLLQFKCRQDDCNAAMKIVRYVNDVNWNGNDNLRINAEDYHGDTPRVGGVMSDSQHIPLFIARSKDVPILTGVPVESGPGFVVNIAERGSILFGADTSIQIKQVDEGIDGDELERDVVVVVAAEYGTLSIDIMLNSYIFYLPEVEARVRAGFIPSLSKRSGIIAFRANVLHANRALERMEYIPATGDVISLDEVHVFVCNRDDLTIVEEGPGNLGDTVAPILNELGFLVSSRAFSAVSFPVRVEKVNDAPRILIGHRGYYVVDEGHDIALVGIDVSDVDDRVLNLQITAEYGTLRVERDDLLLITRGNARRVSIRAPTEDLIAALAQGALVYNGGDNWNGLDTITLIVEDASGATDEHSFQIHVTPVNSPPNIIVERSAGGDRMYDLEEGKAIRIAHTANYNYEGFSSTNKASPITFREGFELWRSKGIRPNRKTGDWDKGSDSHDEGTGNKWRFARVKNIGGPTGSSPRSLASFLGDRVLFSANDGKVGRELWSSDGTDAGTKLVKDLYPGKIGSEVEELWIHDNKGYFSANGKDHTWILTTDKCQGFRKMSYNGTVFGFAVSKSTIFKPDESYDCPVGFHWASTREVSGLIGSPEKSLDDQIQELGNDDVELVFADQCGWTQYVWGGESRMKFRMADSSKTGAYISAGQKLSSPPKIDTSMLANHHVDVSSFAGAVCIQNDETLRSRFDVECLHQDLLHKEKGPCFLDAGNELWETDGTFEGTRRVLDLNKGSAGAFPRHLTSFQGNLFFAARTEAFGEELWRTDGTRENTVMVADIYKGSSSGAPSELTTTVDGSLLFFAAETEWNGRELWVTNGSPNFSGPNPAIGRVDSSSEGEGAAPMTHLVLDIFPGKRGSTPSSIVPLFGKYVAFAASDDKYGAEVWISDGTVLGTGRLTDIYPESGSASPSDLVFFEGALFFSADDGVYGRELWTVGSDSTFQVTRADDSVFVLGDGVPSGQRMVKDIDPGSASSNPSSIMIFSTPEDSHLSQQHPGSHIFFFAAGSLWKSDGSMEGTVRAFQSTGEEIDLEPHMGPLVEMSGSLYFGGRTAFARNKVKLGEGTTRQSQQTHGPVFQAFVIEDKDSSNVHVEIEAEKGMLYLEGSDDKGSASISLDGSVAEVNRALGGIFYQARGTMNGDDRITIAVVDDEGLSASRALDIYIEPVNTPPEVHVSLAEYGEPFGTIEIRDDAEETYEALGLGITPILLEVAVSVKEGVLEMPRSIGLRFDSGNGPSKLLFYGTLEDINKSLKTLKYTCGETCVEGDVLTVYVNDNGGYGKGGPQTTTKYVEIKLK